MLGENNKNLGKIVAVLAKCIGKGSGGKDSLVDSETWRNIVTLLQQMNGNLPAQVTSSFYLCCWLLCLVFAGWTWHSGILYAESRCRGMQVMQEFYSQLKPKERTRLEAALSGQLPAQ